MTAPRPARALLALLLVLGGAVLGSAGASAAPAGAPTDDLGRGGTVLVGVAGLGWSDVDAARTPTLARLAGTAAVGSLTVRAVGPRTCPVDGWLTLSAGRRAADPADGCADPRPPVDGVVPGWAEVLRAARAAGYDAAPGTLGQRVTDRGACVAAAGPGAAVGAADRTGRVAHYATDAGAAASCPLLLVDAGTLPPEGRARTDAVAEVDRLVGQVLASRPGDVVVVAGLADGSSPVVPRLALVAGPRVRAGDLTSPSTRQPGLVQLQDLTATLLQRTGAPVEGLTGRPVSVDPTTSDAATRVAERTGFEQRAATMRALAPQVTGWLAGLFALWAAAVALAWWSGRDVPHRLAVAGVALAAVPVSTFVANLVPWWRTGAPGPAFLAALAVAVAATTVLAVRAGSRWPLGALRVVGVLTLLVLVGDVVTGSGLQLASVFGQNPTVGGRFYGFGNTSFALYAVAALTVVHLVGTTPRWGRRVALAGAALVLVVVLALEAHPSSGADFGGPPGLLLGGLLVLAAVAGVRLTPVRVLVAGAAAALLTVGVAVLDWLRPEGSRTHLGEFVQTVLDGQADDVVGRKVAQNLANLGSPPLLAVAVATLVVGVVLWRGGWRPSTGGAVVLRGAAVAGAVGFAVNDSGLVIPAFVAVVVLPLLLADRPAGDAPPETAAAG